MHCFVFSNKTPRSLSKKEDMFKVHKCHFPDSFARCIVSPWMFTTPVLVILGSNLLLISAHSHTSNGLSELGILKLNWVLTAFIDEITCTWQVSQEKFYCNSLLNKLYTLLTGAYDQCFTKGKCFQSKRGNHT